MKTKLFKSALYLAMSAVFSLSSVSCSSDDPDIPNPVPGGKPEGLILRPASVEINVYDGHLHGTKKFHQNSYPQQLKHIGKVYKLVYTLKDGKWIADPNNSKVNVLGAKDKNGAVAFDIHYFDKNHKEITGEYATHDAQHHYQHFFIAKDIQSGYADKEKKEAKNGLEFFEYVYCDTDPWNETHHSGKGKWVEDDHVVGLKGYFHFIQPYKKFNLEIMLMRAKAGKEVNGKLSSFCAPTEEQLRNEEWLPSITIPVNIYLTNYDFDLEDEDYDNAEKFFAKDESDFSEKDRRVINAVKDAFGLATFREAAKELFWKINGEQKHNTDNFWF